MHIQMKQQVLKALANPARIFYVPYSLAVINFAVQFVVFILAAIIYMIATIPQYKMIDPLWFLVSVIVVHMILASFSKKEPQLGQIVSAKLQLFKKKIPNRLVG